MCNESGVHGFNVKSVNPACNVDIKAAPFISGFHHDYCRPYYTLFSSAHKKVDIFHLCSSKIAWDNYALLQMISESFPARDRFLNFSK